MAMEMKARMRFAKRNRAGMTLVEVVIAIIVISVGLVALLNVFSHTLELTVNSSLHTKELMESYAEVGRGFFVKDLSSPPAGVRAAFVEGAANVVFARGSGTPPPALADPTLRCGRGLDASGVSPLR